LQRCASLLSTSGRLVFDVLNPDVHALAADPERSYRAGFVTHPATGVRYKVSESSHYDPVEQVRSIHMFLDAVKGDADPIVVPLSHRQIFPEELKARLAAAGLAVEARYGDFDRGPLQERSESQVIIARKGRVL